MIKKAIPNFITCLNLLCGCIGIVFAFEGNLVWSAYMVGIAAIFDFLDGFAARILKVNSEIGKQLDSLADMVTFGVLPGVVMFKLISLGDLHPMEEPDSITYSSMIAFLIPIFSAIRLAKFNVDTRQTDSFIGLPTPANAIFISSLAFISNETTQTSYSFNVFINSWSLDFGISLTNPWTLLIITIISSLLLVAPLPLFALKFKNFTWTDNKIRYIFLALCVPLLILFQFVGIPIIIILYIVLSVVNNILNRNKV